MSEVVETNMIKSGTFYSPWKAWQTDEAARVNTGPLGHCLSFPSTSMAAEDRGTVRDSPFFVLLRNIDLRSMSTFSQRILWIS